MKNSKEKWKLEPLVKKVCLATTIFYGVILTLIGLVYLEKFCSSNGVLENIDLSGTVLTFLLVLYIPLYYSMLLYVIPFVIVFYLISVVFNEVKENRNSLLGIHPLIISSIATSIAGTYGIVHFVENSF